MLTDTHCHLADPAYDADRGEVLDRAWAAGVTRIVVIGESPLSADRALELTTTDSRLSTTAGLHPHEAANWDSDVEAWLRQRLRDPRVVAAGEMGLDYHYDHSPRPSQRAVFEAQLAAGSRGRKAGRHSCPRSRRRCCRHAARASFRSRHSPLIQQWSRPLAGRPGPGPLCVVQRHGHLQKLAARPCDPRDPADRLLLETDGPYLAPVPHRGKRNEPAFVRQVAERIALVRGVPVEELIALTGRNALRVFGPLPQSAGSTIS